MPASCQRPLTRLLGGERPAFSRTLCSRLWGWRAPASVGRRARVALVAVLAIGAVCLAPVRAADQAVTNSPTDLFARALVRVAELFVPPATNGPQTFTATIKVNKAKGLPKGMAGHDLDLALQAPDRMRLGAELDRGSYTFCRDGQEVWVHVPAQHFGLIGSPDKPAFANAPDSRDSEALGPLKLPVPPEQLMLLPLLSDVEALPDAAVGGTPCRVLKVSVKPEAAQSMKLPRGTLQLWLRASDSLPLKLAYQEDSGADVGLEVAATPEKLEFWVANADSENVAAHARWTRYDLAELLKPEGTP